LISKDERIVKDLQMSIAHHKENKDKSMKSVGFDLNNSSETVKKVTKRTANK